MISSLPGTALRMHVESLAKPPDVNKRSQKFSIYTLFVLYFVIHATISCKSSYGGEIKKKELRCSNLTLA